MRLNNSPAVDATFIFLLYFLPVLVWCWYFPTSPSQSWLSLSAGMIMASLGSILIFLGFSKSSQPSENIFQPLPENIDPTPSVPTYPDLTLDLEESKNHVQTLSQEMEILKQEISFQKNIRTTDLETKENEIKKLKDELDALHKDMTTKQKIVEEQESKLNDLDYEIKTLIDIKGQEEEEWNAESDAISLSQSLKSKIELATAGAHLDQLIKTNTPSFIFLYNLPYKAVVASTGATPELNVEDLPDLFPINSKEWNEAMNAIEKGRAAPITLTNKTEVTLTPISKGPYKGLILGVSYF